MEFAFMEVDWTSFLEDDAIENCPTTDGDTVMAEAPQADWFPFLPDGELASRSGPVPTSQSQTNNSAPFAVHSDDPETLDDLKLTTIDPSLLLQLPAASEVSDAPFAPQTTPALGAVMATEGTFTTPFGLPHDVGANAQIADGSHRTQEDAYPINHPTTTGKVRKPRSNLPKAAVTIFKAWLQEHENDPYPSETDKWELSARSGLQIKQVNNWFMNARKRGLSSGHDSSASYSDADSLVSSTPARGRSPQRVRATGRSTSTDSLSSVYSPSESEWSRVPKRGRKRRYSQDVPTNNRMRSCSAESTSKPEATFQCTFCGMSLTSKSWRRHEETQHVPQVYWKCMATGPLLCIEYGSYSTSTCAFCGDRTEYACNKDHRVDDCRNRKKTEQTFYRKEHLRQYFRNFHPQSKLHDHVASAWEFKNAAADNPWPCGFCEEVLPNWNARELHIAKHFRDGATMESWDQHRAFYPDSLTYIPQLEDSLEPLVIRKERSAVHHNHSGPRASAMTGPGEFLESWQISSECPHCRDLHQTALFEEHGVFISRWTSDLKFPLRILVHDPSISEECSRSFWLWHCREQSSLVIQPCCRYDDPRRQIWFRYDIDSISCIKLSDASCSDAWTLRITFRQQPSVLEPEARGFALKPPCSVVYSLEQKWTLPDEDTYLKFARWLLIAVPYPGEVGDSLDCFLCSLRVESFSTLICHLFFHEGAHVDPLGNRLSSTTNHDWDEMTKIDWRNDRLGRKSRIRLVTFLLDDKIEFMCGSSLPDGNSCGCKKLFLGVSGLAHHFKSDTGMICWAPLAFQGLSLSDRFALEGLGKEMNDHRIKTSSTSFGLPEILFLLYPALDRIPWPLSVDPTPMRLDTQTLSRVSGPKTGFTEKKALSTIASESTRSGGSAARPQASRSSQNPTKRRLTLGMQRLLMPRRYRAYQAIQL